MVEYDVHMDLVDFIDYASKHHKSLNKSTPITVSIDLCDLNNDGKLFICTLVSIQGTVNTLPLDSVNDAMYAARLYYDALLEDGFKNVIFEPQFKTLQ